MEYISRGLTMGYDYILMGDYIGHLRHFRVWEYSWYNLQSLTLDHHVAAKYCPLGHSQELVFPAAVVIAAATMPPIDALFYG